MISGKKVVAVIPARGGSKGVPRKNTRMVGKKPLIAWTIEAAKSSTYIDRVVLSTDDKQIMQVGREWGCEVPFIRPDHLAADETAGVDVLLHAIENLPGYGVAVVLQPTSPLRTAEDIDHCIEFFSQSNAMSCVSICESDKSPYWTYSLNKNGQLRPVIEADIAISRRQDLPKTYVLNGAIYVVDVTWVKETKALVTTETLGCIMPKERSLDIDTEWDVNLGDLILREVHDGCC